MKLIDQVIDADGYEWLSQHAPSFVAAINDAVLQGFTPEQIRWRVQSRVGPERQGLALRCEQAARYLQQEKGK